MEMARVMLALESAVSKKQPTSYEQKKGNNHLSAIKFIVCW